MCSIGLGAVCVAIAIGLAAHWVTALEFLVGALIVSGPNLWVAAKGFQSPHVGGAIALVLTKYVLAGVGFALWFALQPNSDAIAVLIGSAAVLLATPIAVHFMAKQQQ